MVILSIVNIKSTVIIFVVIGVVLILETVTFMLTASYLSGIIGSPIQRLVLYGEMIAAGDDEARNEISDKDKSLPLRKDEVGALAVTFKKMLDGAENLVEETKAIADGDITTTFTLRSEKDNLGKALNKMIDGTIELTDEAALIAEGDLTTTITLRSEKDILGKALQKLTENFRTFADAMASSANLVDAGAKQVSNSSMSLSQGATEQASSIQQLSAAISEISQNIKANAEDAEKAKIFAEKSGEIMDGSSADMKLTSEAMDEIAVKSKNISKVIKAIDDIAFQTNILALNAAVEAARAGTAGKGFAVVADEVRNLSQKSAEAAKDTTSMIEESINAVNKGISLVNKTCTSFTELSSHTCEVIKLIEKISEQAQLQSTAVSEISTDIDQVSAVVQMNAATSEEVAAASEQLFCQSESLKTCVGKFKI